MASLVSTSPEETVNHGKALARHLSAGDFVSLTGELGAGKTCFARGVALGLGVDPSIPFTSPTYTLMNVYEARLKLYHFDLYRLSGQEVDELGFEEYFYGTGVSLVEWAERMNGDLPGDRLEILFQYESGGNRKITFTPYGSKMHEIVSELCREQQIEKI